MTFFSSFVRMALKEPASGDNNGLCCYRYYLHSSCTRSLLIDLTVCHIHSTETNDTHFVESGSEIFVSYSCFFLVSLDSLDDFCCADKRLMSTQHVPIFPVSHYSAFNLCLHVSWHAFQMLNTILTCFCFFPFNCWSGLTYSVVWRFEKFTCAFFM